MKKKSGLKKSKNTMVLSHLVWSGDEKIPEIIEIAQRHEIKIKSINVRKPTLDDVFLSYTGRTMRDEEVQYDMKANIPPRFRRR